MLKELRSDIRNYSAEFSKEAFGDELATAKARVFLQPGMTETAIYTLMAAVNAPGMVRNIAEGKGILEFIAEGLMPIAVTYIVARASEAMKAFPMDAVFIADKGIMAIASGDERANKVIAQRADESYKRHMSIDAGVYLD